MKSKCIENLLKKVENKIYRNRIFPKNLFNKGISIIIPDTSALIDFSYITRIYRGKNKDYINPVSFVNSLLGEDTKIIIPYKIIDEVRTHKDVKLNGHVYELSPKFISYLEDLYNETRRFLNEFVYGADSEQTKLDVYWASKLSCTNNLKKMEEGFSETDKDLLVFSRLLSTGKFRNEQKVNSVNILSSDEHIVSGVDFLRKNCEYLNLNCISLRE